MSGFGVGGVSPLWRAGFTGNPFRALAEDEWEELALLSPPIAAVFYPENSFHLQITGIAGAGKSSTLRAILREARHQGLTAVYEYLPNGADTFHSQIGVNTLFCLDEAQRLNVRERQRLIQCVRQENVRLCLATHEDLTPLLESVGLRLHSVELAERTTDEYATIFRNRLSRFARTGEAHATLEDSALAFLQAQFGSDLRSAERFLYSYFQQNINAPREITERELDEALSLATRL